MHSRKGMSPWPCGSHRVIPCGLIIAKEREMGNCQVGTLFRGYFFKKFREFWPTKATVLRVKMSQGKMRNQGEKAELEQSSHRRSLRERFLGGLRESSTGSLTGS